MNNILKQKLKAYLEKKNYSFSTYFAKYIDMYIDDVPFHLEYNPKIQLYNKGKEYDSFDLKFMASHFNYGSKANLCFRKFYEDYFNLKHPELPTQSEKMDGYGLCYFSNIFNHDFNSIETEFYNSLNYIIGLEKSSKITFISTSKK
jgi:hypothetical protein